MGSVNAAIWADYMYLKQVYPELNMCGVEVNPRIAVGTVILPELRSEPREIRARLALPIKVVYSNNFPEQEITVYDAEKMINWDAVPYEHRHKFGDLSLCTHHTKALKLVRNEDNRSILIVRSAILLYLAFLECVDTGKWPEKFKDLPHGDAAIRILKRDLRKG